MFIYYFKGGIALSEDNELEDILNEVKSRRGKENESGEKDAQPAPQEEKTEPQPIPEAEPEKEPEAEQSSSEYEYEDDEDLNSYSGEENSKMSKKSKKGALIGIIAAVLIIAAVVAAVFAAKGKTAEPKTPESTLPAAVSRDVTEAVSQTVNPLTGKAGYNEKAVGKRPVSVVVENSPAARPQWGITTPDIIVEGEVEGGISRMLWFYADYTAVPDKIGPIRSARPSYVKFSEFFDSVFVHWGGSHDNSGYTGGYSVIKNDGVDDIDGMNGGSAFGRDTSRSVSSEHRGVLYGNNLKAAIEKKKYRTDLDSSKTSTLAFYDTLTAVSQDACNEISVKFSSRATESKVFKFNSDDSLYHNTANYKTDVSFTNIVVLSMPSEYITVPYKGSRTTYLNYKYTSGSGKLASNGTVTDITWSVDNNKLTLKDANGAELKLNQGKSWIGLASSNNKGAITVK